MWELLIIFCHFTLTTIKLTVVPLLYSHQTNNTKRFAKHTYAVMLFLFPEKKALKVYRLYNRQHVSVCHNKKTAMQSPKSQKDRKKDRESDTDSGSRELTTGSFR